jgi:predicted SnoaL-like aldol condensation-catalyzing enzyme
MMKRIAFIAGVLALAWAPLAQASPASNKALVLKVVKVLFNEHKVDEAFDRYFRSDYIQHDPMAATGAEAARVFFKKFYADSPAAAAEVHQVLADGDLVTIHYLFKMKPEDRGFAVVDIFRIKGGKLAEHWDVIQPVPEKSANDNGMF